MREFLPKLLYLQPSNFHTIFLILQDTAPPLFAVLHHLELPLLTKNHFSPCFHRSWVDYYLLAFSGHCGKGLIVLCPSRAGLKYPTDVLSRVDLLCFFLRISFQQTFSFVFVIIMLPGKVMTFITFPLHLNLNVNVSTLKLVQYGTKSLRI